MKESEMHGTGSERVTLEPGVDVIIRPIRPEDRHLMAAAFSHLPPEARYQRFFAPVEHLSEADLTYLTEIDHSDHEALVAIDPEDGSLVGVTRYVCLPAHAEDHDEVDEDPADGQPASRPREAEVAVIVGEPWQGKGLATALLQRLARRASEEGVDYFIALVLRDNESATSLFRNLVEDGTEVNESDPGQVEIEIELPGPEAFSDSMLARALRGQAKGTLRASPWRRLQRRLARNRERRKDSHRPPEDPTRPML